MRIGMVAYAVVLTVGLAAWAFTPTPTPWTPAFEGVLSAEPEPGGRVNWAAYVLGTRVRVSDWDRFRSHHPLFLIDGQRRPTQREKWATLPGEPSAWLELDFGRPRLIDTVVLRHAAWREPELRTHERYRITCYRGDSAVARIEVTDNRDAVARNAIACPGTNRLRIEFDTRELRNERVRLYEVEAWGMAGDAR